jgi:hypothetical protein
MRHRHLSAPQTFHPKGENVKGPDDAAPDEVLFLVIRSPIVNRSNVTWRTIGWKAVLDALVILLRAHHLN